jgi:hypothetical protein
MKIGWYFLNVEKLPVEGTAPDSTFKDVAQTFDKSSEVLICPAVHEYFKNTFLIRSPVDIEFQHDLSTNTLRTTSKYVVSRPFKDRDILTFPIRYMFVSDSSVTFESIPAFMHNTEAQTKLRMIPGSFDIGKWIRPVDFTAQSLTSDVIKIKQGDPLYYVRFMTDEKVELEHITDPARIEKIHKVMLQCTGYKFKCPGNSLKSLYKIAENWINIDNKDLS